jgi:DNA (cytosine-5)-methyltransferase 1
MRKLTHGSLFSGIGGFDLAAEWMGWDNKFHCEWNEFGKKVLNHYWPEAESFIDITKTDFTKYYGTVDIITGGFPCQPYSSAGKRLGKEDERHLWPEMLRAIREVSPRFVVGENVRGLTNWNGGMVFEEVCAELESYGYQVAPVIIPACGVNAPHRRERIWFVAYAPGIRNNSEQSRGIQSEDGAISRERTYPIYDGITSNGDKGITTNSNGSEPGDYTRANNRETEKVRRKKESNVFRELSSDGNVTHPKGERFQKSSKVGELERKRSEFSSERNNWDEFPTQSPVCSGDDGLSSELDGITFPKWRNESIKAYGNAIVPQVAYQIFKAIEKTLYL